MAVRAVAHRLAVLVTMIILIAAAVAVFWQHSGRAVWYDEAWVVEFAMRDSARGALHDTLARKQPAAAGYIVLMQASAGSRAAGRGTRRWACAPPPRCCFARSCRGT